MKKKKKTTCTFSCDGLRPPYNVIFSSIPQGNEKISNQFLSDEQRTGLICPWNCLRKNH